MAGEVVPSPQSHTAECVLRVARSRSLKTALTLIGVPISCGATGAVISMVIDDAAVTPKYVHGFSADRYRETFEEDLSTIAGTFLNLAVTYMGAYALAKRALPFRNTITLFILFTMFFSGGLIPTYLVVKNLGLIDTRAAMILPPISRARFAVAAAIPAGTVDVRRIWFS